MANRRSSSLPHLPSIRLSVSQDRSPEIPSGFLSLRRIEFVAEYPDGSVSSPFVHDMVTRHALDAVVVAAHYLSGGERHVFLRSCVRPVVMLRPIPPSHDGAFWELPAGLIEPGEDPAAAAAREIEEELGFALTDTDFVPLGPWTFPVSGLIAEHHYFFHVRVDPAARRPPSEDGSPLERGGLVADIPLRHAIDLCRAGALADAKTELGLRRLAELE